MAVSERRFPTSPDALFDVLADPTTYPDWLVGAQHIRDVSEDWPAPGSEFHHRVGWGPLTVPDRTSVISVDPPRRLVLRVRARPLIEAHVDFVVRADDTPITAPDGQTRSGSVLTMTETPAGAFRAVWPLLEKGVRVRNEASLDRLREFLDARDAAAATPAPE